MSKEQDLPPCKLLLRSKESCTLYNISTSNNNNAPTASPHPTFKNVQSATLHACSPDGNLMLFQTKIGIVKRNLENGGVMEDGEEKAFLEGNSTNIANISFSPLGTYILTWERPIKPTDGSTEPPPNLKIFSSSTGKCVAGFHLKMISRATYPPLRWTNDESHAFHMVTNELRVYKGDDLSRYTSRIRSANIGSFTVAPIPPDNLNTHKDKYVLSTFAPEHKGKPAKISLLRYPDRLGSENKSGSVLCSKSCFNAEEITLNWSPRGDALLCLTHTSVDKTGESYYGSTNLHLLTTATAGSGDETITVPLPNGTPVMDVAWNPDAVKHPCFCVVSGKMPAMASLHHGGTGEAIFLYGNAHRNTVKWSDSGRFLCLAGFGNLAGGMDFWDHNKQKKIPQYSVCPTTNAVQATYGNKAQSAACNFGFSPDSRTFFIATTTPRMNVDNGVRLYKYNGFGPTTSITEGLLPNKLLAAEFLPKPKGCKYPDRPQSPPPKGFKEGATDVSGGDKAAFKPLFPSATAKTNAPSAPVGGGSGGAYVPPSARNRSSGGGGSLAQRMRAEREGSTVTAVKLNTKTKGGVPGMRQKTGIVGAAPVEEKKSKGALRREKLRLKKQQEEEEEEMLAKQKKAEEEAAQAANAADPEKRAKKIKKILKRIDELKKKDPSTLDSDQKKKLGTEEELRSELAKLGL